MRIFITAKRGSFPTTFSVEKVTGVRPRSYTNGALEFDSHSEFYPKRSDEKVMREDIKSLVIEACEMMKDAELSENEINEASLFVANGAFVEGTEKYMSRSVSLYHSLPKESSLEDKLPELYKVSPPLLALITLTNSSMSFVAQYCGIKGNNATYGTTSLSMFHAIEDAIRDLKLGRTKHAIVCSTNCAGNYSFLMNSSILPYHDSWTEGAAVGCFILEAHENVPKNALAEITHYASETRKPSLETYYADSNWVNLIPERSRADEVLLTGAYNEPMDETYLNYAKANDIEANSLFKMFGNIGPVNIYLGLHEGMERLNENKRIIDVVDKDVYGKESLIRIEHV